MKRFLLPVCAVFFLVPWLSAALFLGENAVRVPPRFRAGHNAGSASATLTLQDGVHLYAWAQEPTIPWNGRAVILLHGVADSHRGMQGMAKLLASHGYRVFAPDSRGHGASEGNLISYGLQERDDVRHWIDWMDKNWKPSNIFGFGASMGASILLQTLPQEPRIRAIVAECPFSTFRSVAYHRVRSAATLFFAPSVEPALFYTNMRYNLDLTHADPEFAIRSTQTPVLLIHGTNDVNIPMEHSRRLYAARPNHTELWIVPGAGHIGVSSVAGAEYQRRILAWFESNAK